MGKVSFLAVCVLMAAPLFASDPASVVVLTSGELAILDASAGISKVSGTAQTKLVESFGLFQPVDLASARVGNQDSILVTLRLTQAAKTSFSRLSRLLPNGKQVAEWPLGLPGGALVGVTFDPRTSIAYCSDSQLGNIYRLDLRKPQASLTTFATIREPSTLGPIVVDVKRHRLLVADVRRGRIFAVALGNGRVTTVLDTGTVREPLGMAIDPAFDRLYIADATKERVWVGRFDAKGGLTVKSFETTYKFREPTSVALSGGFLWVVDREAKQVVQLSHDGFVRKLINL